MTLLMNFLQLQRYVGRLSVSAFSPTSLRHDYFALRHGQSQANVERLIVSSPTIACTSFGLSQQGQEQAKRASQDVVQTFQAQHDPAYAGLVLLSSDFLRAKQTAQAVLSAFNDASLPVYANDIQIDVRLRERWFGDYDMTNDDNYHKVWKKDALLNGPSNTDSDTSNVESVYSVADRVTQCVTEWDERLTKEQELSAEEGRYMVVCVAHGDVLQILQTAFAADQFDASQHRLLPHLETAQLRSLMPK